MSECGASLADEMEYPTDALLLPLIQLHQIAEEHHLNMCIARGNLQSREEVQRVQTHLNAFRIQLGNWKARLSNRLQDLASIDMACHFATMHAHEMDLINPLNNTVHMHEKMTSSTLGSFSSRIRLDVLLICLEATKRFCEGFLALPPEGYRQMSFVQWSGLIYATVILYKLSVGLQKVPEWDASVARSAISIEDFVETLRTRMDSVSDADPASPKTSLFCMMGSILENVGRTYDRLKRLPQSQSASDTNPVHATSFPAVPPSAVPPVKKAQHRCPAFPFWKGRGPDMFDGVEGFVGSSSDFANTAIRDAFTGFDLEGDHDLWAETMPEAATLTDEWGFPSY
jgi:hypothetical protein